MPLRHLLPLTLLFTVLPTTALSTPILYGGNGGHTNGDSVNDGSLVAVNQTTGAVSLIGHPAGVSRITGLAFDPSGFLFATTLGPGGFPPPPGPTTVSTLIEISPTTGATIATIGAVTAGGLAISIVDLAIQPVTGVLYGIEGPQDQLGGQGKLYTINKSTGVATLLGATGDFFASIAFAPNGMLYMASADLDNAGGQTNIGLKTLNPGTGATLSFHSTAHFFGALAIRPSDSAIFGGIGDGGQIFTINPITGAETLVGGTGQNFVGDLEFVLVPEPGNLGLLAIGLLALWTLRSRLFRAKP